MIQGKPSKPGTKILAPSLHSCDTDGATRISPKIDGSTLSRPALPREINGVVFEKTFTTKPFHERSHRRCVPSSTHLPASPEAKNAHAVNHTSGPPSPTTTYLPGIGQLPTGVTPYSRLASCGPPSRGNYKRQTRIPAASSAAASKHAFTSIKQPPLISLR